MKNDENKRSQELENSRGSNRLNGQNYILWKCGRTITELLSYEQEFTSNNNRCVAWYQFNSAFFNIKFRLVLKLFNRYLFLNLFIDPKPVDNSGAGNFEIFHKYFSIDFFKILPLKGRKTAENVASGTCTGKYKWSLMKWLRLTSFIDEFRFTRLQFGQIWTFTRTKMQLFSQKDCAQKVSEINSFSAIAITLNSFIFHSRDGRKSFPASDLLLSLVQNQRSSLAPQHKRCGNS